MATSPQTLKELIAILRQQVTYGGLTAEATSRAIDALKNINSIYAYDDQKFPALQDTESFAATEATAPISLAEALLWKLGKWKAYRTFSAHFSDPGTSPRGSDVVFYAFARHLRNRVNPIYDQHSLRALWAICPCLKADEADQFRKLLFSGADKWKEAGSGSTAVACYESFKVHLACVAQPDVDGRVLDRLLMPLGRAIKRSTDNYEEFRRLLEGPPSGAAGLAALVTEQGRV